MAGGDGERRPCGGTVPLELLIGEQARTEKRERPLVRVRMFRPVQERGGLLRRQDRLPWRPPRPVLLLRFCAAVYTRDNLLNYVMIFGGKSGFKLYLVLWLLVLLRLTKKSQEKVKHLEPLLHF